MSRSFLRIALLIFATFLVAHLTRSQALNYTGTHYGLTTGDVPLLIGSGSSSFGFETGKVTFDSNDNARNIQNSFFGAYSGYSSSTGDNNVFLGYRAGYSNNGSSNIFLGYRAGHNETGSNKLYIDNSDTSTPLIWGDFSTDKLRINGMLGVGRNPNYQLDVAGDTYVRGNLFVFDGGYLDDDTTPGGGTDDWIKFNGHIRMRSSNAESGMRLLSTSSSTDYLNLTQKDGISYFSNSNDATNYFLRGTASSVYTRGDLFVEGDDVRSNDGNLRLSGDDDVRIVMDYKNNHADTRRIQFGKNDEDDPGFVELAAIEEGGDAYFNSNLFVTGDLDVRGGDIRENNGDLRLNGEDNVQISMDYNNNDDDASNQRRIQLGKNDEGNGGNFEELLSVRENGHTYVNNDLYLDGGDIRETSGDLRLNADENVQISMDFNNNDDDAANSRRIQFGKNDEGNGGNFEELMSIRENGNTHINYDLIVEGSDIRDNSGSLRLAGEDDVRIVMDHNNDDNNIRSIQFGRNNVTDGSFEELMRLSETGNLGIGITTPTQKLSVAGEIRAANDDTESEFVVIGHGGSNGYVNTVGDGNLDFRQDGDTKMSITDAGKVGIGTTSPIGMLDITSTGSLGGQFTPANAYFRITNGTHELLLDNNEIYSSSSMILGKEFDSDFIIRNVNAANSDNLLTVGREGNVGMKMDPDDVARLAVSGRVRSAFDPTGAEYVEMWHGGGNAYVNWVGDGNLDFRYGGADQMSIIRNEGNGTADLNITGKVLTAGGSSDDWNQAYDQRPEQVAGQGLNWDGSTLSVNNAAVNYWDELASDRLYFAGTSFSDLLKLSNIEQADASDETGVVYFDINYAASQSAFPVDGGGLVVRDEDGWGALVSTTNMQFLDADLYGLEVANDVQVNGAIATALVKARNNAGLKLYNATDQGIFIDDTGAVGLGTDTPLEAIHLNGTLRGDETLGGALNVQTANGQVQIGPQSANAMNFTTDRGFYHFDTTLVVQGGTFASDVDDNLRLVVNSTATGSELALEIDQTKNATLHGDLDVKGKLILDPANVREDDNRPMLLTLDTDGSVAQRTVRSIESPWLYEKIFNGRDSIMAICPDSVMLDTTFVEVIDLNGNIKIGPNAYIDDDVFAGDSVGGSDDWIKFSNYLEFRSADENKGLVLVDREEISDYLNIHHQDDTTYFANSKGASDYFLRSTGKDVEFGGDVIIPTLKTEEYAGDDSQTFIIDRDNTSDSARFHFGVDGALGSGNYRELMSLDEQGNLSLTNLIENDTLVYVVVRDTISGQLYARDATTIGPWQVVAGNLGYDGGQVGIGLNGATPSSTLDVGGEMKVRTIPSNDTGDVILVTDTTGVIQQRNITTLGLSPWEVGETAINYVGDVNIGADTALAVLDVKGNTQVSGRVLAGELQVASLSSTEPSQYLSVNNLGEVQLRDAPELISGHNDNYTKMVVLDTATGRFFTRDVSSLSEISPWESLDGGQIRFNGDVIIGNDADTALLQVNGDGFFTESISANTFILGEVATSDSKDLLVHDSDGSIAKRTVGSLVEGPHNDPLSSRIMVIDADTAFRYAEIADLPFTPFTEYQGPTLDHRNPDHLYFGGSMDLQSDFDANAITARGTLTLESVATDNNVNNVLVKTASGTVRSRSAYTFSPWDWQTSGQIDYTGNVNISGGLLDASDMRTGNLTVTSSLSIPSVSEIAAPSATDKVLVESGGQLMYRTASSLTGTSTAWVSGAASSIKYNDGNVGIGTGASDPTATLEVNGDVRFSNLATTTSNEDLLLIDPSGNILSQTKTDFFNGVSLSPWTQSGNDLEYSGGTVTVDVTGTNKALIAQSGGINVFQVDGTGYVRANKLKLTPTGWSDYVLRADYDLRPLEEVEAFIEENEHLPEVPSEAEVLEEGVEVTEMQSLLLKKIEELTLYIIDQDKQIKEQDEEISQLKELNQLLLEQSARIAELERKLDK